MRKIDVFTKEDVESYYNKTRKIKLKGVDKISINKIFKEVVINKEATTYSRGGHQCEKNRERSIDDFIKVAKYYYPDTPVKDILLEIDAHIKRASPTELSTFSFFGYCPNIRKDNFRGLSYYKTDYEHKKFIGQGFPNCDITFKEMKDE